jgi:hypothetical protein
MNHNLLFLLLTAICLSSCNPAPQEPQQGPSPVQVLQDRVESERQSRIEAQQATVRESEHRRRWELAATAASILALAGFLLGTILGSRGRRHAEKEATL